MRHSREFSGGRADLRACGYERLRANFAQPEREVTGERIGDKVAASNPRMLIQTTFKATSRKQRVTVLLGLFDAPHELCLCTAAFAC
jgi:hypothetical protein